MNEPAATPEKARAIIEAILLTAEDPVSPGRLVSLLDGLNGRDIREAIDALKEQYKQAGHGITIIEVANGFQLATRQELSPWIRKFHKTKNQIRLSQAALESLSIIAFKQPITRIEVDSIRGVNSAGVLQNLMELGMVRIVGRSDGIGKPMLFGTTREFLIHFGLKSLTDLPKPRELEELLATGEQKARDRDQLSLGLEEDEEAEGQPTPEEGDAPPDAESAPEEEGDSNANEDRETDAEPEPEADSEEGDSDEDPDEDIPDNEDDEDDEDDEDSEDGTPEEDTEEPEDEDSDIDEEPEEDDSEDEDDPTDDDDLDEEDEESNGEDDPEDDDSNTDETDGDGARGH
ncbi:MAG: SMC-Scp complex subunit ScpB [Gemmatimonadetes bacterium]|nr:SMC-Scp complex subunit ScpB [Gemmatimonadota bacterium]